MVRGTPESKAAVEKGYRFDTMGVLTFMVAMLALQVLATQGSEIGWTNPITLGLGAIAVVVGVIFFRVETSARNPFVNFALFRNPTYTGATISNLLLNGVAGMLLVSMMLVQLGGGLSAQQAGLLTLGYAIAIVAFIRVGEKLLQRFGARRPMIWGSLIVGLSIAVLMPTNLLIGQYTIVAVVAYTLFGLGLAFYATPSTDAALSNLPNDQAGSGSGLYKMASSLGASFGVAISAAIFTALSADSESTRWLEGVITFAGRQDNVAVRKAALMALAFNLLMVVAAIVSIMLTVPEGPQSRSHAMNAAGMKFAGQLETTNVGHRHAARRTASAPATTCCRSLTDYVASHACDATTMAATPVSSVGCRTGANPGLWFVGISRTRPACLASAYFFASVPPTNQKTDGVCHAAPNTPKSSLADVGLASRTRSLPKCCRNASTTRRVASGSLVTRE